MGECRLWHASRFASFSPLTRCQEETDFQYKVLSSLLRGFQIESVIAGRSVAKSNLRVSRPDLNFFKNPTESKLDPLVMRHGARHEPHDCQLHSNVSRLLTASR